MSSLYEHIQKKIVVPTSMLHDGNSEFFVNSYDTSFDGRQGELTEPIWRNERVLHAGEILAPGDRILTRADEIITVIAKAISGKLIRRWVYIAKRA